MVTNDPFYFPIPEDFISIPFFLSIFVTTLTLRASNHSMMHQEDTAIIQRILQGSVREFGVLVERHKNLAYTMAFRLLNNREDAEEVIQDAFVKAYQHLSDFRHDSRFSTWLFRIVYNTAVSKMRLKRPIFQAIDDMRSVLDKPDMQEHNADDEAERGILLERAMQTLSPDERTLITLYYLQESGIEEIHGITGLTCSNIKVKLFRARKKMQEVIVRDAVKVTV